MSYLFLYKRPFIFSVPPKIKLIWGFKQLLTSNSYFKYFLFLLFLQVGLYVALDILLSAQKTYKLYRRERERQGLTATTCIEHGGMWYHDVLHKIQLSLNTYSKIKQYLIFSAFLFIRNVGGAIEVLGIKTRMTKLQTNCFHIALKLSFLK